MYPHERSLVKKLADKPFALVGVNSDPDLEKLKGQLEKVAARLIGVPAPEIEAEDADGKKFKLSDYKGKVVMIDFWGDW